MKYNFTKLTGAGNDFILFDGINNKLPELTKKLIKKLCLRGLGVGADGILVVHPSERYDYKLNYFNADGSGGMLCANGARSSLIYANKYLSVKADSITFECCGNSYSGVVVGENEAIFYLPNLPFGDNISLNIFDKKLTGYLANSGAPQVVIDFAELKTKGIIENRTFEEFQFSSFAKYLRHHEMFAPGGVNVNVITDETGKIKIRSFERGIEGETLACGTGIIAAAMFLADVKGVEAPIEIYSRSGKKFIINFRKKITNFESVSLRGHAEIIYNGNIILKEY